MIGLLSKTVCSDWRDGLLRTSMTSPAKEVELRIGLWGLGRQSRYVSIPLRIARRHESSRLENGGLSEVLVLNGIRIGSRNPDRLNSIVNPALEFWDFLKTIRDLESLKFRDDLRRLHMLIEVDKLDVAISGVRGHCSIVLIANVDEAEIREIHADEWKARWDTISESLSKNSVIPLKLDNLLQSLQSRLRLGGDKIPSLLQSGYGRRVHCCHNRHERVVVVQLHTLVADLNPLLDQAGSFLEFSFRYDRFRDKVHEVVVDLRHRLDIDRDRRAVLLHPLGVKKFLWKN